MQYSNPHLHPKDDPARLRRGLSVLKNPGASKERLAGLPFGSYVLWRHSCQLAENFSVAAASNQLRIFENHILPTIGQMAIGNISPEQLCRIFEDFECRFEMATALTFASHVRNVFERAVHRGAMATNPAAVAMRGKKAANVPKTALIITEESLVRLEQVAWAEARLILDLVVASRASGRELCALCWEDIDFERGSLRYTYALDGTMVLEQARPKRARAVQLDESLIQILKAWKVNNAHLNSPLVFTKPSGGRYSGPRFDEVIVALQQRAGFPSAMRRGRRRGDSGTVHTYKRSGYQAPYTMEQVGNIAVLRAYRAGKNELELLEVAGLSNSRSLASFKAAFQLLDVTHAQDAAGARAAHP